MQQLILYSILFYSNLFYSILFYSILFYSILSYSILFYSIIFHSTLRERIFLFHTSTSRKIGHVKKTFVLQLFLHRWDQLDQSLKLWFLSTSMYEDATAKHRIYASMCMYVCVIFHSNKGLCQFSWDDPIHKQHVMTRWVFLSLGTFSRNHHITFKFDSSWFYYLTNLVSGS